MDKFKNLFKSEFARNVLTLMTGTVLAQAIPIAISPILTRIYTPEDFGVLSLFIAITAITGVIVNAKYEQAVVLPEFEKEAISLLYLGLFISTVVSALFLVCIFLLEDEIVFALKEEKIREWLYFIPLSTFLIGLYNMFNYYNIREKKFNNVSKALVYKSAGLSVSQLALSFVKQGAFGLILGQILSFFCGNLVLIKSVKGKFATNKLDFRGLKSLAIKYKKFPLFSMPSVFLNAVNLNMINFLITTFYTIEILGFYSLTQRIIGIPSRVLGSSFGQVYFQKATEEYQKTGKTLNTFKKTLKKLVLIGIPIFTLLFFISEPLFELVFGVEWRVAGYYSKLLTPLAFSRFISSALSTTMTIHMKQQLGLFINISLITLSIVIFVFSKHMLYDFQQMLIVFSCSLTLAYLTFIYLYWRVAKS